MDIPKPVKMVIFEGIATIIVEGVGQDAYMTIHTESAGRTIRWFGTFEWMGEQPEMFPSVPSVRDVVLSDGREAKIRIPYGPPTGDRFEFLGIGIPPGFERLAPVSEVAEQESSTPTWRVFVGRLFTTIAFALTVSAVWVEGYEWRMIATGFVLFVLSAHLNPRPSRRRSPEVPGDHSR
jgi:hypothetical protein